MFRSRRLWIVVLGACLAIAGGLVWRGELRKKHGKADPGSREERVSASAEPSGDTEPLPGDQPTSKSRLRELPPRIADTLRKCLDLHASTRATQGLDLESVKSLQAALDDLGSSELLRLLRELDASDLEKDERARVASFIAGSLARRDPLLALDTFLPRAGTHPEAVARQLDVIYSIWARQDVEAAADWFDQQVDMGAFAALDLVDLQEEMGAQLVRAEAARFPDRARVRWQAMSDEAKQNALQEDWFSGWRDDELSAVTEFLRRESGGDPDVLTQASSMRLRQGGLDEATRFLEQLGPHREELPVLVEEALRLRVPDEGEPRITPLEAREWILEHAPESSEVLTGSMLARFVGSSGFPEVSGLASHYSEEAGSDLLLAEFLKNAPTDAEAEIIALATEIQDEGLRMEVLSRFSGSQSVREIDAE